MKNHQYKKAIRSSIYETLDKLGKDFLKNLSLSPSVRKKDKEKGVIYNS